MQPTNSTKQQNESKTSPSSYTTIRGLQLRQGPRLLGTDTGPSSVGIEERWRRAANP